MKKKTIFINGYFINPINNTQELLNIFLINGVLVGFGYLPDEKEEDLEIINLNRAFIIPNIIDLSPNEQTFVSVKNKDELVKAKHNNIPFIGTSPYYFFSNEIKNHDKNFLFDSIKDNSITILHSFCDLKIQPRKTHLPLTVSLILNNFGQCEEIEKGLLTEKISTNICAMKNQKYPGLKLGSKINFMIFDPKKKQSINLFNKNIELKGLVTYHVENGEIKKINYE
ncbi:MAG: hypothetical protein WC860_06930 [Candidatus Margulisiibacteriota bacterium]|jgi:hypothetical protein